MLHTWASWIRTSDCRSQSPVPYRLAIAHYYFLLFIILKNKKGWVVGLEPTTSRTTIWRANQLHHTHHILLYQFETETSPGGFEPSTYGLEGRCSIQLSYGLILKQIRFKKRVMGIEPTYPAWKAGVLPLNYTRKYRGDRIRTCDLLVPNQAL